MELNLYRIIFETGDWTVRHGNPGPFGHAHVLASDPETAKQFWITDSVMRDSQNHPNQNIQSIIRTRWTGRWQTTELIKGPFENGFVICNTVNT